MFWNRQENDRIYADYAASTPVSESVFKAMQPYWSQQFANPNAIYQSARISRKVVEKSKDKIRDIVVSKKDCNIVFTSGGTESNQLAIGCVVQKWKTDRPGEVATILCSSIEHPSIEKMLEQIISTSIVVVKVSVNLQGKVVVEDLVEKLEQAVNPILVTVVFQSGEMGTTQSIKDIHAAVSRYRQIKDTVFPYLHSDMSQGVFFHTINIQSLGIDLLTLCAQKIFGPKGSGLLVDTHKLCGRDGTPAVSLIAGITQALVDAQSHKTDRALRIQKLRELFFNELDQANIDYLVNGFKGETSHIINLSFSSDTRDSEELIVAFDAAGLEVSSKAACLGSQEKDSYVLEAMGLKRQNSIRLSINPDADKRDIITMVQIIAKVVPSDN